MSILLSIEDKDIDYRKDFTFISAKTGTGKTTCAIKDLRGYVESRAGIQFDIAILLTPYSRTKNQILSDERFSGLVRPLNHESLYKCAFKQRINETIVTTYAGLCNALRDGNITLDGCLLIFDELHTFVEFTRYQPQMSYLLEWLVTPELWERFIAVGMTGTPELLDYCNKCDIPFRFKDITPDSSHCFTCTKGQFINGGSAKSYAKYLIQQGFSGSKLFYVESAKDCYDLSELFNDAGYQAAYIVSPYHDKHTDKNGIPLGQAMESQLFDNRSIVEWIDETSDAPPTLRVLVINASARDGINIIDSANRFDEAVIESANRATVEQARSRIRHDLERLTVIYNRTNKLRTVENITDAVAFFKLYESASEDYERSRILIDRLLRQIEEQGNKSCDLIAMKGKTLFLNPFIKALTTYELDNYQFSSSRTYENENGDMVTEETVIKSWGKTLPTFQAWRDELKN